MIHVFDQAGRLVLTKATEVHAGFNQIQLNTTILSKGIYELKLTGAKIYQHVRLLKD